MRTGRGVHHLVLRTLSARSMRGHMEVGWVRIPCAIGRGGTAVRKREGDGATPAGRWPVRCFYYRADRVGRAVRPVALDMPGGSIVRPVVATATSGLADHGLPGRALRPDDGWCDAPADRNYNRHVRHPYPASAERMWRPDGLYDIVVVLGHNDHPRSRNHGSAIFVHCASPGFRPTEGCLAVRKADLARLLPRLARGTTVVVGR
ncbi:MAG: L,D-transpeptidase family protein [Hyphomicrobiaceae bacterium]|nr:L,D-transpeptidase family protein [Hyphomicrobiaceae bacterium]